MNLVKLPFSIGLGLVTLDSVSLNLTLVPAVLIGALLGRALIRRIDQRTFERVVVVITVVAAVNLVR